MDSSLCMYDTLDPYSGKKVRFTDNGLKPGDLPGIPPLNPNDEITKPLKLDENGLPLGFAAFIAEHSNQKEVN